MAIAGRVAIVPDGAYDPEKAYKKLTLVYYQGNGYIAKKNNPKGPPEDGPDWMLSVTGSADASENKELRLKLEKLTAQVEEMRIALLTGQIKAALKASQGGYITDSAGGVLLVNRPICGCSK